MMSSKMMSSKMTLSEMTLSEIQIQCLGHCRPEIAGTARPSVAES